MLRKIVFVLIALALPLVAAQTASAGEQYPPTGEGSTTVPARTEPVAHETGGAPLARTGSSDLPLLGGVAGVLLVGGAVVVVASRRRSGTLPA